MASLIAAQLESRNVGSNISFEWNDKKVHGVIAILEKDDTTIDVTLGTSGEIYDLSPTDRVDIHLSAEANFLLYTKVAIEQLVAELTTGTRPPLLAAV